MVPSECTVTCIVSPIVFNTVSKVPEVICIESRAVLSVAVNANVATWPLPTVVSVGNTEPYSELLTKPATV
jgi:hypothetical protein